MDHSGQPLVATIILIVFALLGLVRFLKWRNRRGVGLTRVVFIGEGRARHTGRNFGATVVVIVLMVLFWVWVAG